MDEVRYKLTVLGMAVRHYEESLEAEVQARWMYEMKHLCTPADEQAAYMQLRGMEEKKKAARDVLLQLTGLTSVDAARDAYLDLLTTYNLWGSLAESFRIQQSRRSVGLSPLPPHAATEAPGEQLEEIMVHRAAEDARMEAQRITLSAPSQITLLSGSVR